jgi:hypothetical protein
MAMTVSFHKKMKQNKNRNICLQGIVALQKVFNLNAFVST